MEKIRYRKLKFDECHRIQEMNPSQYIKRAWREVVGKRQLVDINYHDKDWPNGYSHHVEDLKETILNQGVAYGAFNETGQLIGFATLNKEIFGEQYQYVLLDQLFISLENRKQGIGKKLFMLCAKEAKSWHVDRIYICAGSAEETIAFYFAIGCVEAKEINQGLYESDPRDYQLEYQL